MVEVELVLVMPNGKRRKFAVKKPRLVIGRATDCSLQIPSSTVSRHHCELLLKEEGLVVNDLKSANGTFVNKTKIDEETPLPAGATLAVGPVTFTVTIKGQTPQGGPARPQPRANDASGSVDLDELDALDDLEEVAELEEVQHDDPVAALSALTNPKKLNLPSPKPSAVEK